MTRIKIIDTLPGVTDPKYAVGKFVNVEDSVAKRYVAAGMAEEAPSDGATALDNLPEAIAEAVRKGVVDGIGESTSKGQRPDIRDDRIDSIAADFKGLPIFGSHGGFLHAVKEIARADGSQDAVEKMDAWRDVQRKSGALEAEKVYQKGPGSPSAAFEANDPDGGALVIPEFAQKIYERLQLEENFLAESSNLVVRGNTLTMPALDDSSRVDGSRWGAVLGAWANEAEQLTQVSQAKFRTMDWRLKKLYIFTYITDELLSDSPYALEQYVSRLAAKEIAFKTNDAMIRGNGGGMPLGILNSPALITVSAETGQASKTILFQNIENMWMRMNYYCRKNAVWLINQDCEKQLQSMAFPVGIGGVPIYQPQGGVSNPSYATLKGRPVKIVEFCETLGTSGDILLTNWEFYQTITKGGIKSDMSMHLRFQYGEMAYRFTFRMDGKPLWDKALTPYKGTNTTSSMIALAAR